MNKNTLPIPAYVKNKFLYNMDDSKQGFTKCKIVGVTTFLNETLTFQILTQDGALFSYIPAHALFRSRDLESVFDLNELVYSNCDTTEIDVFVLTSLKTPLQVFLKKKNMWIGAEYLFTVDYTSGNQQDHVIWLSSGQLAIQPNHKINFNNVQSLPDYRALHATWRV